jgi:hypothetical protein
VTPAARKKYREVECYPLKRRYLLSKAKWKMKAKQVGKVIQQNVNNTKVKGDFTQSYCKHSKESLGK